MLRRRMPVHDDDIRFWDDDDLLGCGSLYIFALSRWQRRSQLPNAWALTAVGLEDVIYRASTLTRCRFSVLNSRQCVIQATDFPCTFERTARVCGGFGRAGGGGGGG